MVLHCPHCRAVLRESGNSDALPSCPACGYLGTPAVSTVNQAASVPPPGQGETGPDAERTGPYLPAEPPEEASFPVIPGYQVLGQLGRGGMGVVYQARQTALNRLVALKMIRAERTGPGERARFRAEAEAAARLQHPHIVQVFEVGEHQGELFYALEWVPGGGLDRRLRGTPLLPYPAARLVELLARAIHGAHERNLIHRDLKPANVLIQNGDDPPETWIPKVTDFGLAKFLDVVTPGLTQAGVILGTPSYMAPEQALGRAAEADRAADVYALGAILYECLTGRPPFRAASTLETLELVRTQEPVPVRQLQPRAPRDLETICQKCLSKDPRKRYPSAADLGDDLARFRTGRPILARPVGPAERFGRWCRRHPVVATLAGLLVAATLTASGLAVLTETAREAESRARQDAVTARQRVEDRDRDNRRLLAQQFVANGARLEEQDDAAGAALWYAQALRVAPDDPDAVDLHRRRLGSALANSPRPSALWFHDGDVTLASFSADGRRVLTVSGKTVHVWEVATGAASGPALVCTELVRHAAFSRDADRVLTFSAADPPLEQPPPGQPLPQVGYGPFFQGEVRVWDPAKGAALTPALPHRDMVEPMLQLPVFGPGDRYVLTQPDECTLTAWNAATGQPLVPPLRRGRAKLGWLPSPDAARVHAGTSQALGPGKGFKVESLIWDVEAGTVMTLPGPLSRDGFSPDGRSLVGSGSDNALELYDAVTGQRRATLCRSGRRFLGSFSRDGRFVQGVPLSGGTADEVRVWEAATGKEVGVLKGEALTAWHTSPEGNRYLVTDDQGAARLHDPRTGKESKPFVHGDARVTYSLLSPDGLYVVTVGDDQAVRVWDAAEVRPVSPSWLHDGPVTGVQFSPDGSQVLTVAGNKVRLWSLAPAPPATFRLEAPPGSKVIWSADGRRLLVVVAATPPAPTEVRVWDAASGRQVAAALGVEGTVGSVCLSPDGRRVLLERRALPGVGQVQEDVRLWDTATGQTRPLHPRGGDRNPALDLVGEAGWFSADGRRVVTVRQLPGKVPPGAPPGAVVPGATVLQVWDADTGEPAGSQVRVLAPSAPAQGRWLCGFAEEDPEDFPPRVFDLEAGTSVLLAAPRGELVETRDAVFSPDGAFLVTATAPMPIPLPVLVDPKSLWLQVWDARTGAAVSPRIEYPKRVDEPGVSLSPDGRRLLLYPRPFQALRERLSRQLRVWEARTGRPLPQPMQHDGPLTAAVFSPDGTRVASASADGTARIWDAASGEAVTPPLRLGASVAATRFSPDGRRLLTVAATGLPAVGNLGRGGPVYPRELPVWGRVTVRAWDAATGEPAGTLTVELPPGRTVTIPELLSPNGDFVAFPEGNGLAVQSLGPTSLPLPDLEWLAQALAGRTVNAAGGMQFLATEDFQRRWQGAAHEGERSALTGAAWHRRQLEGLAAATSPVDADRAFAVVWHLDHLLAEGPGNRDDVALRGRMLAVLGRWDRALTDLDRAIDEGAEDLRLLRGQIRAGRERWDEARADFAAAARQPAAVEARLALGLVCAFRDDREGYREVCRRLLADPAARGQASGATADLCLLTPAGAFDLASVTALVQAGAQGSFGQAAPPGDVRVPTEALLAYRRRRYQEAANFLEPRAGAGFTTPVEWFVLALAQQALQRHDEARESLAQGVRLLEKAESQRQAERILMPRLKQWQQPLVEQLLHREAEQAVNGTPP